MNRHPNWSTAFYLALIFGAFFLAQWLDAPSDMHAEEATAANLRDALAQAQQDRPDMWTPERIERAGVAAGMVAQGVK